MAAPMPLGGRLRERRAQARMGQTEIRVALLQRHRLPQAILTLPPRAASAADRRPLLAKRQGTAVHKRGDADIA